MGERDADPAIPTGTPFEPIFFETADALRAWLDAYGGTAAELFVGGWRKASGRTGITWAEIVDEALCFGWIDSIRRSLPGGAWSQRLTPRRKSSNWSAINVANVERLRAAGRMRPAGEAAFALRTEARTGVYSFEREEAAALEPAEEARFRAVPAAWDWFSARPPSFRRVALHWVVSAKRPETRERRLAELIERAGRGETPRVLTPPGRNPDGSRLR